MAVVAVGIIITMTAKAKVTNGVGTTTATILAA